MVDLVIVKGEVLGGDFDKILMRVKSDQKVELGEILAIDMPTSSDGKKKPGVLR